MTRLEGPQPSDCDAGGYMKQIRMGSVVTQSGAYERSEFEFGLHLYDCTGATLAHTTLDRSALDGVSDVVRDT